MAKSLDGLIRHLIDQIALCGEHGESTRFLHNHLSISSCPRFPCFKSFLYILPHSLQQITLRDSFPCISVSHILSSLFFSNLVLLQNRIRLGLLLQSSLPWLKHHIVVSNKLNTSPALANKYAGFTFRVLIRIRSLNFRFHHSLQELLLLSNRRQSISWQRRCCSLSRDCVQRGQAFS